MTYSVVIPVYNGADTIIRAVDSVLIQTLQPLEIIVVDDASTDETVSLLERTFSGQVKIVRLGSNEGSAAARNAGMDVAIGAYIAFLDADDTWHPEKLHVTNAILSEHPGVALFYHSSTLKEFDKTIVKPEGSVKMLSFARLLRGNYVHTPCAVIRNDTSFRFEPSMRYMEDYDLWLRIAYRHKVFFCPQKLARLYRPVSTEGGISSRKWDMRKGEMKAYLRLARLNPLFVILLPLLLPYSLLKHAAKMVKGKTRKA
ncbi:MAG: glycosyltransferase family 2 protein [Taibaiella sp.]|nr:glycosyltransferase family 2 protein [Taibaiella sp.]